MDGKVNWMTPLGGSSLDDWKPTMVEERRLSERHSAYRERKKAWAREYRRRRKLEGRPVRGGNYYAADNDEGLDFS